MRTRYLPWTLPDGSGWGILDWSLMEFCGLPDEAGKIRRLSWNSRQSADAWLQNCYITWRAWEGTGEHPAPRGWKPRPEGTSPYDNGMALPPANR
jgi:hypothetical protein